eukprot:CAMPEP_0116833984 /NCGR_PEP_ID=MMETSP0418-20121206/6742_1 /TAXON_ID=1158023 /ORGANISM="Astrosyne radiata, Strain 13vi08-1A" /LENGTH=556 /DNA_ID=CAMNT_0004463499 /DNA_START=242 /DNA_END=1912 /DNA_ORIENTATION=+
MTQEGKDIEQQRLDDFLTWLSSKYSTLNDTLKTEWKNKILAKQDLQVELKDVSFLPSWLEDHSWKMVEPCSVIKVLIKPSKEFHIEFDSMNLQGSIDKATLQLVALLQSFAEWGFDRVTLAANRITMTVLKEATEKEKESEEKSKKEKEKKKKKPRKRFFKRFRSKKEDDKKEEPEVAPEESEEEDLVAYEMAWANLCVSMEKKDAGGWEIGMDLGALGIPHVVECHGVGVSGVWDAGEAKMIHELVVSIEKVLLIATNDHCILLKRLLEGLVGDGNWATPNAHVLDMECEIHLHDITEGDDDTVSTEKDVEEEDSNPPLPWDKVVEWKGKDDTMLKDVVHHYTHILGQLVHTGTEAKKRGIGQTISDVLSAAAGRAVAGAALATPVGLAMSFVGVGVKDGITAAAKAGKKSRGESEDGKFKVGDVARGVAATIRKKTSSASDANEEPEEELTDAEKQAIRGERRARYGRLVGMNVGAGVGLVILGGPVAMVVGGVVGGIMVKGALDRKAKKKQEALLAAEGEKQPEGLVSSASFVDEKGEEETADQEKDEKTEKK